MKTQGRKNFIIAVAIAATLLLCTGIEAKPLVPFGGGSDTRETAVARPIGLLDQALSWMTSAWTSLKAAFAEETTGPGPQNCTNPNGCSGNGDSGWTIDPEG